MSSNAGTDVTISTGGGGSVASDRHAATIKSSPHQCLTPHPHTPRTAAFRNHHQNRNAGRGSIIPSGFGGRRVVLADNDLRGLQDLAIDREPVHMHHDHLAVELGLGHGLHGQRLMK